MEWNKTYHRRKICIIFFSVVLMSMVLCGRLVYLMLFEGKYYETQAKDLQQRERKIKAARGKILDRNGVVLADNKSVCTISVIHNQIKEPEAVIAMLVKELGISEEKVRKRVEKYSSLEKIKSNVDKETGNRILAYGYAGVKVDEDYKRNYPYDTLASKVLGFTGGDNQGIIGLESVYDKYLEGTDGLILTTTDARGVEVDNIGEERKEPVAGNNLRTSLDANIQMFAMQAANKAYIQKEADSVSIIVMNPSDGAVMAMVDYPEFHLNEPFQLIEEYKEYEGTKKEQEYCNRMWRNQCINDTYEPGSTFKVITAAAALEEGVVSLEDRFHCPGYIVWRTAGFAVTKRPGMEQKALWKESKIPAIPCLSMWDFGSVPITFMTILSSSVCYIKRGLTCRERLRPSCTSGKRSGLWNWQPSHSDSHFRSHRSSWQPPFLLLLMEETA